MRSGEPVPRWAVTEQIDKARCSLTPGKVVNVQPAGYGAPSSVPGGPKVVAVLAAPVGEASDRALVVAFARILENDDPSRRWEVEGPQSGSAAEAAA